MGDDCHYLLCCGARGLQLRCESHCATRNSEVNPAPKHFQSQIAKVQGLGWSVLPLLNPWLPTSRGGWAEFPQVSFAVQLRSRTPCSGCPHQSFTYATQAFQECDQGSASVHCFLSPGKQQLTHVAHYTAQEICKSNNNIFTNLGSALRDQDLYWQKGLGFFLSHWLSEHNLPSKRCHLSNFFCL